MNEDLIVGLNDLGLLKQWERLVLFAYPDPVSPLAKAIQAAGLWEQVLSGHIPIPLTCRHDSRGNTLSGAPWTIFYGHTGPDVYEGLVGTEDHANSVLMQDTMHSQEAIRACVTVKLTIDQFVALIDLTHNIGTTALKNSTLVRLLNLGNTQAAADQFRVWIKAGGVDNQGLKNRREADRALFLLGSAL